MKNNMNLWTIIGIVIVVAVIASLITTGITGNVINLKKSSIEANDCLKNCQKECLKLPVKNRPACNKKCLDSCNQIYTKAEVDDMMKNVATYQGVLDMLRAYVPGNCRFVSIPEFSENSNSWIEYRNADSNGDKVTTGTEWASSLDATCLYGFRTGQAATPIGVDYITSPVGCAGAPTFEMLKEWRFPDKETYLFCTATK